MVADLGAASAAAGAKVATLKEDKAEKELVDAAVAELLKAKAELKSGLEEAVKAAEAAGDKAALSALQEKLAAATPKPSGKDTKKGGGGGESGKEDAEKAANIKAAEEAKAAARAKKKAAVAEGGAKDKGNPAQKEAAAATPGPPAAAAEATAGPAGGGGGGGPAAPTTGAKATAQNKGIELHSAKAAVPLLALTVARLAKIEVTLKRVDAKQLPNGGDPVLYLPLGKGTLAGAEVVARYLARAAQPQPSLLYGTPGDALSAGEADHWVHYAQSAIASAKGPALTQALQRIERHLRMRTVIAGHAVGLADAAVWLALRAHDKELKADAKALPHLARWWRFVEALEPMQKVAQEHFGAHKDAGNMDIPLPGAEMGKVVTRFPPEPSGHLHIGHVKAAMLNAHFATQYGGRLLLRFDDTNPSKEKGEYEEAIIEDLRRLEITPSSVSHTSDHFAAILALQTRMLEQDIAYVDPSPQEEQKKERMAKQENKYRSQPVAENLRLWGEMQRATEEGLQCCVRAKIDMKSNNGTLRDPCTFRTNLIPHHQTKDKYKVYPTYDLACPIVDSVEGVTHALRDRQYSDRDAQYEWFIQALRLRPVNLWGFSRINFVRTLLSKRKLQWIIDQGKANGWDDPRFPTVGGILKRGMTVAGLKQFILSMGASKNSNLMEWDKLWNFNKNVIDPTAHRYTALLTDGLVPLTLAGAPAPFVAKLPLHPKDASLGKKVKAFSPTVLLQADDAAAAATGEEVTLMGWGNALLQAVHKDDQGRVASLDGALHLQGDVKAKTRKLTWLADSPDLVACTLVELDYLLNKDKVEEDDDVELLLTPTTRYEYAARGEAALRLLQRGQIVQLERRGYYICNWPYLRASEPIELIFVPDGKKMMGIEVGAATPNA